jgi:hypothetical protein
LTTNKYPCIIPYTNLGVLPGRSTPKSFYPSSNDNNVSLSKYQYLKTSGSLNTNFETSKTKYNAPICSSMRTQQIRANSIGKSNYNVLNETTSNPLISFKAYNPNDVFIHKKFVRSGGCTAPKKVGSIYNTSRSNGATCCWGELPRQNY